MKKDEKSMQHDLLSYSVYGCSMLIAWLIKASGIFGSTAFFSGMAWLAPLSGFFGGAGLAVSVAGIRLLKGIIISHSLGLHLLAYWLPGFCAALYWARPSYVWAVIVPLCGIGLFFLHPVGNQAFLYSCYWFIPVVLYYRKNKTRFEHALISTFIAHAVGSTIWLYTISMDVASWQALIPLVIVERIVFAFGMTVSSYALAYVVRSLRVLQVPAFKRSGYASMSHDI